MPRYWLAGCAPHVVRYCWADSKEHAQKAIIAYCGLLDAEVYEYKLADVYLAISQDPIGEGEGRMVEPDFRTGVNSDALPKEVTTDEKVI